MSKLAPVFRFATYPASALRALYGANEGDAIGVGDDAVPGDTYRLNRDALPARLAICDGPDGGQVVADSSDVGTPGDALSLLACHSLMGPKSDLVEVLVLRRHHADGAELHILPLSPLQPAVEYELISCDVASAPDRFADIASVSFFAGTRLTMADGRQRAVEDLQVGDMLLTRNHGPQPVRWIGHQTRRATGSAAPIRISEGTLNTVRDLRLSPQHRLLIWQRRDELGAGRAEVMVRADLLVNGTSVVREEGGHIDSYQLVMNGHEIIYAEGIAVESLLVTANTLARLPSDLALDPAFGESADTAALEVDERTLGPIDDAAARLTRASRGTSH
jgi:hypothetical protein